MEFYQTPAHLCGYLPNRYSVNIIADPNKELSSEIYSTLIDYGFRRNGKHLYRPQCPHCSACVPTRVCVNDFKPNRSQQRTIRINQDLNIKLVSNNFVEEHYELYKKYLVTRHTDSPMTLSTVEDYKDFIIGSWSNTHFLEMRIDEKLICVAVFDLIPQGLSAVYSFYDPGYGKRSLGTFAILKLIEEAQNRKLPNLYLGYWIKECNKMSYKVNFKPIQGYINKSWQNL